MFQNNSTQSIENNNNNNNNNTNQSLSVKPIATSQQVSPSEQKKAELTEDDDECDEDDEENENYDDYADTDEIDEEEDEEDQGSEKSRKHSFSSKTKQTTDQVQTITQTTLTTTTTSSIKLEQNEKMIKKNKVIELYTKGERCVRKLSQLTGVPLTTVYRVIGKLKGINYNIPRGNGAGRKTILDSQDREILVEILNKQPRISRKALGKELEKLTGKSIHNSTLNRELCRLRYQGQNFTSQQTPALIESSKKSDQSNPPSNNYMKHFSNKKSLQTSQAVTKPILKSSSPQPGMDEESLRLITNETKRFCSQLTQYDIECKPIASMNSNLSKQIIEICQMSTNLSQTSAQTLLQLRLDKTQQVVAQLLNMSQKPSFYEICLQEACVQMCLLKPTLLTRQEDMLSNGRRILENCSIFDENNLKSKLKRNALANEASVTGKRIKLEQFTESDNNISTPAPQQLIANNFSLYTAALALHLQQQQQNQQQPNSDLSAYLSKFPISFFQSHLAGFKNLKEELPVNSLQQLIQQNEQEIKQNLKYQEELKLKLFSLSMSSANNLGNSEQIRLLFDQVQSQLSESIKRHAELLNEQARLKNQESREEIMSDFSNTNTVTPVKVENLNQKEVENDLNEEENEENEMEPEQQENENQSQENSKNCEDTQENIDILK